MSPLAWFLMFYVHILILSTSVYEPIFLCFHTHVDSCCWAYRKAIWRYLDSYSPSSVGPYLLRTTSLSRYWYCSSFKTFSSFCFIRRQLLYMPTCGYYRSKVKVIPECCIRHSWFNCETYPRLPMILYCFTMDVK